MELEEVVARVPGEERACGCGGHLHCTRSQGSFSARLNHRRGVAHPPVPQKSNSTSATNKGESHTEGRKMGKERGEQAAF